MAVTPQARLPVLVDGVATHCLDAADRSLHYGDGVFSTLSVRAGVPGLLDRHLARLQADAAGLGIPFPGRKVLVGEIFGLASRHPSCVLKVILTRGVGGRGYRCLEPASGTRVLSVHPRPEHPPELAETGVRARFCALRLGLNPRLAGVKHLNRLEQVLARAEWGDDGVREGLLLDWEGFVAEGVMSNVFMVREGRLLTPRLDRCGVAGVVRGLVLDLARERGMPVEEARILPAELLRADELFLTNSVIGVWPVCELDGRAFPVGGFTRWLAGRVADLAAESPAR